jgi:hypothetical protein
LSKLNRKHVMSTPLCWVELCPCVIEWDWIMSIPIS